VNELKVRRREERPHLFLFDIIFSSFFLNPWNHHISITPVTLFSLTRKKVCDAPLTRREIFRVA
jgi:hypothetical protein